MFPSFVAIISSDRFPYSPIIAVKIVFRQKRVSFQNKKRLLIEAAGMSRELLWDGKREDCERNSFKLLSHSETGLDLNKEFSEFKGVFH